MSDNELIKNALTMYLTNIELRLKFPLDDNTEYYLNLSEQVKQLLNKLG